jgi:hypothetical protein
LLFGYDTAVISGAVGFLQMHFQLDAGLKGWAVSKRAVCPHEAPEAHVSSSNNDGVR